MNMDDVVRGDKGHWPNWGNFIRYNCRVDPNTVRPTTHSSRGPGGRGTTNAVTFYIKGDCKYIDRYV